MSRTRSLVTGGLGFVGRDLVRGLVERGDDVTLIDVGVGKSPVSVPEGVRALAVDIRDAAALREVCKGQDVVFHTASLVHTRRNRIEDVRSVNVDGTHVLLEAARAEGVKRFVYVSSASVVYEGRDMEGGDESLRYATVMLAPYAATKVIAEKEVLADNGVGGMATMAIRPHVVFGPGDARFLPEILGRARAGKLKFRIGMTDKLSDFTYIENLTDALIAADERLTGPSSTVAGQAYFITNGEPMAFWDFVSAVADACGYAKPTKRMPFAVAYAVASVVEGLDTLRGGTFGGEGKLSRFSVRYLCTHHWFRIDKARRDLGYAPKVSVRDGITRTLTALAAAGKDVGRFAAAPAKAA